MSARPFTLAALLLAACAAEEISAPVTILVRPAAGAAVTEVVVQVQSDASGESHSVRRQTALADLAFRFAPAPGRLTVSASTKDGPRTTSVGEASTDFTGAPLVITLDLLLCGGPCPTGGVGVCVRTGVRFCAVDGGATWQCTGQPGPPAFSQDQCHGQDDDCDGRTDVLCLATIAGGAGGPGFQDGLGSAARFNTPTGVVVGAGGALFVADMGNRLVRRVDVATGRVTTFAGRYAPFDPVGETDGASDVAILSPPGCIAYEPTSTDLIICGDATVRRIRSDGSVQTLAGQRAVYEVKDAANGANARFAGLPGLATSPFGIFVFSDARLRRIESLAPHGAITLAGNGDSGTEDGATDVARLDDFGTTVFDPINGRLYLAEASSGRLRYHQPASGVTTVRTQLPSMRGIVRGPAGFYLLFENQVGQIDQGGGSLSLLAGGGIPGLADGVGQDARFRFGESGNHAGALAYAQGKIYIADTQNHRIRVLDTGSNLVTTLAGGPPRAWQDGDGATALFSMPSGLAWRGATLLVADRGNNRIRSIDPAGMVRTVAGNGQPNDADGLAPSAAIRAPFRMATVGNATYIVNFRSSPEVRHLAENGRLSTASTSAIPADCIAAIGEDLYFCDYPGNRVWRARAGLPLGPVTLFAGAGDGESDRDGASDTAALPAPAAIAEGPDGIYVGEYAGGIRKIAAGVVSTWFRYDYDTLYAIVAMAFDAQGRLWVADQDGRRISRIDGPDAPPQRFLGTRDSQGCADGPLGATALGAAQELSIGPDGALWIADSHCNRIRRFTVPTE